MQFFWFFTSCHSKLDVSSSSQLNIKNSSKLTIKVNSNISNKIVLPLLKRDLCSSFSASSFVQTGKNQRGFAGILDILRHCHHIVYFLIEQCPFLPWLMYVVSHLLTFLFISHFHWLCRFKYNTCTLIIVTVSLMMSEYKENSWSFCIFLGRTSMLLCLSLLIPILWKVWNMTWL